MTTLPLSLVYVTGESKKPRLYFAAFMDFGAGNETRTRDPNLGKVVLYQLSYSRLLTMPKILKPGDFLSSVRAPIG